MRVLAMLHKCQSRRNAPQQTAPYSITSSARPNNEGGTSKQHCYRGNVIKTAIIFTGLLTEPKIFREEPMIHFHMFAVTVSVPAYHSSNSQDDDQLNITT